MAAVTQQLADAEDLRWRDITQDEAWTVRLSEDEVRLGLAQLRPEVPWCHYFKLGDDVVTVRPDQTRYWGKARGLKTIGRMILSSVPYITRAADVRKLRVLDLACAEGAHSLEFAQAGAQEVLGIEGRQLYVDRAQFIARCFGLESVQFRRGDVRLAAPEEVGRFDLVLFLGILHHLSSDDFTPMLQRLHALTSDTMVLYTHTSERGADTKFTLTEEQEFAGGIRGRLYREHPDDATPEQREKRIRNSIDNTFSFWAREASLLNGLKSAGFRHVSKLLHPHPFGDPTGEFRNLYICRA